MPVQLPFVPSVPNYRFATVLNDTTYLFDVHWNIRDAAWTMDISEQDETPIRTSIKIVLGTYLGRQSTHVLFRSGVFVAVDTSRAARDAGLDDLGDRVQVFYYTLDEIFAASVPVVSVG